MTTIKTETLKKLLAKASKGVANNKLLPITTMLCLQLKNNELTVVTTDGTNYLYVRDTVESTDDLYVVVDADSFIKLISKTTSANISLELQDFQLNITGNGKYKLELPVDENGKLIVYPVPDMFNKINLVTASISKGTVDLLLKTNKAALSDSFAEPCYTGYYMSDCVITSDRSVICYNDIKIFDEPTLISADTMDLLSVIEDDKVDISVTDNNEISFVTKTVAVFAHTMSEVGDFNAEAVTNLIKSELPYECHVDRKVLLSSLDRLSIFVGPYDRNIITLNFTKDYLELTSAKSSAVERVRYTYINETANITYNIDIEMLKKQLAVQSNDIVEMWYGNDMFIKFVDGDTSQLVPLSYE